MDNSNTDEINTLIQKGQTLLQRIQGVQDADLSAAIVGYLGRMVAAHVKTPSWKDTAHEIVDAGVDALSSPSRKLHEDYTEWYTDCKILFSKRGWNRSRLVKVFDDVPNLVIIDSVGTKVRLIVERQIEILVELADNPPKTWSLVRAAVLVGYTAICVFIDTILSILFGLAVVPVAAFQVGLVLAFPKLEEWIAG